MSYLFDLEILAMCKHLKRGLKWEYLIERREEKVDVTKGMESGSQQTKEWSNLYLLKTLPISYITTSQMFDEMEFITRK